VVRAGTLVVSPTSGEGWGWGCLGALR